MTPIARDFAVRYHLTGRYPEPLNIDRLQPLRAQYDPGACTWTLFHPDPDVSPLPAVSTDHVTKLGGWGDEPTGYLGDTLGKTWQQVAAHAWGQVLRQRELVKRLQDLGVDQLGRREAPYGWDQGTPVGEVFYSLQLNFDELSHLLDLAEDQ